MRIEVKVPVLPESITEATLVNWHKKAGESVKRDENLIDIETDKVVLELPAPNARAAPTAKASAEAAAKAPAAPARASSSASATAAATPEATALPAARKM